MGTFFTGCRFDQGLIESTAVAESALLEIAVSVCEGYDGKMTLAEICGKHGLSYLRLFGSGLRSMKDARDVDLVVEEVVADLARRADLIADLEAHFGKPVDLIELQGSPSPLLVREIAQNSQPLWEAPESGRAEYAVTISRLTSLAEDERLRNPVEFRIENLKSQAAARRKA